MKIQNFQSTFKKMCVKLSFSSSFLPPLIQWIMRHLIPVKSKQMRKYYYNKRCNCYLLLRLKTEIILHTSYSYFWRYQTRLTFRSISALFLQTSTFFLRITIQKLKGKSKTTYPCMRNARRSIKCWQKSIA